MEKISNETQRNNFENIQKFFFYFIEYEENTFVTLLILAYTMNIVYVCVCLLPLDKKENKKNEAFFIILSYFG